MHKTNDKKKNITKITEGCTYGYLRLLFILPKYIISSNYRKARERCKILIPRLGCFTFS